MLSRNKPELKLTQPVAIETIIAHMAGSIGEQKARVVVDEALTALGFPRSGVLPPESADLLFASIVTQEGLVGLAGRVAKQMVRLNMSPLRPASS